jgi:hypothetical protein
MKNDSVSLNPSPGRRAASYWFIDGLPDLVSGLALILCGIAGLLWRMYAPSSWNRYYFVPVGLGFIAVFWNSRAILEFLKSRVTYPRTGYAQPPDESPAPRPLITLSLNPRRPVDDNVAYSRTWAVMVIWWYCIFSLDAPLERWAAPVVMPLLAATLYAVNRKSESPYQWWSALILALTGPVLLWVDLPPLLRPLAPLLLAGAWLAAQGACTFVGYLRANPCPQATEGVRA